MAEHESRDVVKKTYLTPSEAAQLSEWATETGKSESALLREAVLEYLDRDRAARVESKIDDLADELSEVRALLSDGDAHTHKPETGMNQASPSVEKAREMVRRIQRNNGDVIKTEDIERAIEDYAGADGRTIRKYKRIFRRRGLVFEHLGDRPLWTVDTDQWFEWVRQYAQLNGVDDTREAADEYPAKVTAGLNGGIKIELAEVE